MTDVDVVQPLDVRVAGDTNTKELATAIMYSMNNNQQLTLVAVGVRAVSTTVKAVAAANQYMGPRGFFLVVAPAFATETGDVEKRPISVMRMTVHKCRAATLMPVLGGG